MIYGVGSFMRFNKIEKDLFEMQQSMLSEAFDNIILLKKTVNKENFDIY